MAVEGGGVDGDVGIDDFEYLSDAPADEVFEALESKSANAGLSWIMTVLDTLLSSNNDIG